MWQVGKGGGSTEFSLQEISIRTNNTGRMLRLYREMKICVCIFFAYLFTEIFIGFGVCWSVVVVLNDDKESNNNGDDHRRLAARTICWMISDGLVSLFKDDISGFTWLILNTGGNFGIWGLISVGSPSYPL